MSYLRRKDTHHRQIVSDLLRAGFSVADTSSLGNDFPDLVVGRNGLDRMVEIKSGKKIHHQSNALREGQEEFRQGWRGASVIIAYTVDDVLNAFNLAMR